MPEKPAVSPLATGEVPGAQPRKKFPRKVFVLVAAAPIPKKRPDALEKKGAAVVLGVEDPEAIVVRATEKMLQIIHEAIYMFDGRVVDPFATVIIGVFNDSASAVKAALEAQQQLRLNERESGGRALQARLVVVGGWVEGDVAPRGPLIEAALGVLKATPPFKVAIAEEVVLEGKYPIASPEPMVVIAEVKFFELLREARRTAEQRLPSAVSVAPAPPPPPARNKMIVPIIIGAGVVFAGLLAGVFALRSKPPVVAAQVPRKSEPVKPARKAVFIAPFTLDLTAPAAPAAPITAVNEAGARATAEKIRLAALEYLRAVPLIDIKESAPSDATFSAAVTAGPAGLELRPQGKGLTGAATPFDAASAVPALVQFVSQNAGVPSPAMTAPPAAMTSFADAVFAAASGEKKKAVELVQSATKADPLFLAAHVFAARILDEAGDRKGAMTAARTAIDLDSTNLPLLRQLARWNIEGADPISAVGNYARILEQERFDPESLMMIGRYALSAGDSKTFETALARLGSKPSEKSILHDADLLFFSGRPAQAEPKYYEIQSATPNNPSLSLKLGRVEVLRHSTSLAQIELTRLEKLDPNYGHHILKAYMDAEARNAAGAVSELKLAEAGAKSTDDFFTQSAEVYAILNRPADVVAMLEKAWNRGEATASYILANPVFRYLEAEPAFQQLKAKLRQQRDELKQKLATVVL